MAKNFVDNSNMTALMTGISEKIKSLGGAYTFRGSVTFANLPATLTQAMGGYIYNVSDAFTTDARFVEGAGVKVDAGTNVGVADLSTYSAVSPVGNENPHTEGWYEEISGKYVLTNDTEIVSGKTYYSITLNMKFDLMGTFEDFSYIADMIAGAFSTATAYTTGDIVVYDGALYKFKVDHAAGAWNSAEVDQVTVAELLAATEPDSLTTAQVNALLALLN